MPTIVMRMKFKSKMGLGQTLIPNNLIDFLNSKMQKANSDDFSQRIKKFYVWESNANKRVKAIMDRILATYKLGDLGDSTILGVFNSTYPGYVEFWICSSSSLNCIRGRRCLLSTIPSYKNFVKHSSESDTLILEGDTKIKREGKLSKYLQGGFNIGFAVNLVLVVVNSIYNYYSIPDSEINYQLPVFVAFAWLIVFIGELFYNRNKGVYVVKE